MRISLVNFFGSMTMNTYVTLKDPSEIMPRLAGRSPMFVGFALATMGIKCIEKLAVTGAGPDKPDKGGAGLDVIERTPKTQIVPKVKKPPLYRVLLHNDDFTPHGFVVDMLKKYFNRNEADAFALMRAAERHGTSIVGLWTFDVAETKIDKAMDEASKNEHPLKFSMEPDI